MKKILWEQNEERMWHVRENPDGTARVFYLDGLEPFYAFRGWSRPIFVTGCDGIVYLQSGLATGKLALVDSPSLGLVLEIRRGDYEYSEV